MRFRIFTALLVVSLALVGWPVLAGTCGMSCCAPSAGEEVQLKGEPQSCCCCEDGKGSCSWERATHKREPLAAHTSESHSKQLRTAKALPILAFLQTLPSPREVSFGPLFRPPTGPPVTDDLTTLHQVMLC
jgi:hypothetical protein